MTARRRVPAAPVVTIVSPGPVLALSLSEAGFRPVFTAGFEMTETAPGTFSADLSAAPIWDGAALKFAVEDTSTGEAVPFVDSEKGSEEMLSGQVAFHGVLLPPCTL